MLESGAEGAIHLDQVLEYDEDPTDLRDLLIYQLTVEAKRRVEESGAVRDCGDDDAALTPRGAVCLHQVARGLVAVEAHAAERRGRSSTSGSSGLGLLSARRRNGGQRKMIWSRANAACSRCAQGPERHGKSQAIPRCLAGRTGLEPTTSGRNPAETQGSEELKLVSRPAW